jgi:hypothetical protein
MSISRWGMSKCMCCSAIRPNSRVVVNPDMPPFWGNFRVGSNPPATREDVQNTCESASMSDSAEIAPTILSGDFALATTVVES